MQGTFKLAFLLQHPRLKLEKHCLLAQSALCLWRAAKMPAVFQLKKKKELTEVSTSDFKFFENVTATAVMCVAVCLKYKLKFV